LDERFVFYDFRPPTSDLVKMAKEQKAAANPFFRELFQWNVYKKNQGRITRQVTFAAIAIVVALGGWRLSTYTFNLVAREGFLREFVHGGVPMLLVLAGWWIAFRLVNMPNFADFLIAVEAEMNKVTWPSRTELIRSSLVVIFTILLLAGVLYAYDLFWNALLMAIGVLQSAAK
jgi:preprotein translocase subunit SecE